MSHKRRRGVVRHIDVGGGELSYRLLRRRTRYLSISVDPDLSVLVVAPTGVRAREVDERVLKRLGWIRQHQRNFLQYHPLPVPRRFVSGETHRYLGRQYRLRLKRGPRAVKLVAGRLVVATRAGTKTEVQSALESWYRARARGVFARRFEAVLRSAPWLRPVSDGWIRIRRMNRRWGSCSARGTITLSPDLVKAAPSCIEYVIAHELTHRLEMTHSRRFYRLLARAVPNWEQIQERLNRSAS